MRVRERELVLRHLGDLRAAALLHDLFQGLFTDRGTFLADAEADAVEVIEIDRAVLLQRARDVEAMTEEPAEKAERLVAGARCRPRGAVRLRELERRELVAIIVGAAIAA